MRAAEDDDIIHERLHESSDWQLQNQAGSDVRAVSSSELTPQSRAVSIKADRYHGSGWWAAREDPLDLLGEGSGLLRSPWLLQSASRCGGTFGHVHATRRAEDHQPPRER
jgi:hypothetical protein